MRLLGLGLCACLSLVGCSVETRGRGQSCQRTAQCGLGLACVAGKCTTDLRPVAANSTVPDLSAGRNAAGGGGQNGASAGADGAAGSDKSGAAGGGGSGAAGDGASNAAGNGA